MYVVLANEIADVDLSEFKKVGKFHPEVGAMPTVDVSVGIKGMRTSDLDEIEDCQNSAFVTYETMNNYDHERALLDDPFIPGLLYYRDKRHYAELKYIRSFGLLSLVVYFLVALEDCDFTYEGDYYNGQDAGTLSRYGLIIRN